nr:MAG TPA: hypothetical protein [Caudoviricetes sp.]
MGFRVSSLNCSADTYLHLLVADIMRHGRLVIYFIWHFDY